MKRTRKQRFIGVDATSAGELAELLNEQIEHLQGVQPDIKWFDNRFSALLVYTEHVEEPENIRDEYELRGECYTCGDCPLPCEGARKCSHCGKCACEVSGITGLCSECEAEIMNEEEEE